jgi:hypothetical protein
VVGASGPSPQAHARWQSASGAVCVVLGRLAPRAAPELLELGFEPAEPALEAFALGF